VHAVFFKVFCENVTVSQNTVGTRFATTMKIQDNFALRPYRYSDKMIAVSQNVFAVSEAKLLKNPATAHAFRAVMKLAVCCYDNRSHV